MSAPPAASHTLPLRNCYWVVPGLLLAGEHPNGPTRDKTKERLKKLLGAGIECFVDLTKPTELLRYDTFLPFHVEYTRKAIKDHGLPNNRAQMTEILEYIANALRAGRPVYVHCRAGIGRTGTVVGCFLAERGMQGNGAIDELNRLWQQCRRSRSWPFIPETDAQTHFVREWTPALEGGFDLSSLATAVAGVGPMTADGGVRGGMVGVAEANVRARGGLADGAAGAVGDVGSGSSAGPGAGGPPGRAGQGGARSSVRTGQGTGAGGSSARTGQGGGAGGASARAAQGAGAGGSSARTGQGTGAGGSSARAGQGTGAGGSSARAGQGSGAAGSSPRVGSDADNGRGSSRGAKSAAVGAGRSAGAGLRAAAEQARAAVERGEVQAKAPPVPGPGSTTAPTATPPARRGRPGESTPAATPNGAGSSPAAGTGSNATAGTGSNATAGTGSNATAGAGPSTVPQFEFQRGEISPSVRAEIADALAGRNSASGAAEAPATRFFGMHGTAAPNGGEEAPWANVADSSGARDATADPSIGASRRARGASATDATCLQPSPGTAAGDATGARRKPIASAADAAGLQSRTAGAATDVTSGAHRKPTDPAPDATGLQPRPGATASHPKPTGPVSDGQGAHTQPAVPGTAGRQPESSGAATDATGARIQPAAPASEAAGRHSRAVVPPPSTSQPPSDPGTDFDPLLDPDTLAAARGLRERFVGTLFGLAVGDAVAAATQFRRPGTFTPIGDMLGGGPFDLPRGAWSDDTAMALCLAESLLERDGFDARDQVQRYSRWQQDGYLTSTGQCVGITASTARSLALAKWRRGLVFPGSHDPDQLDPEPLSRIASIALFYFSSLETTLLQAVDSARITCQATAVLDACRRLGGALNAALSGQSKTKILAEAGALSEAASQTNTNASTALSAAFWAFGSTDNFRDAILRAANVGGNSDVVASVCGQIAGAHYGATAIPQSWRSGLIQKDLIESIADRLLAHALVSLSS